MTDDDPTFGRCRSCTHWRPRVEWGECDAVRPGDHSDAMQATIDVYLYGFEAGQDSVEEVRLHTRPTFGCVLWSARAAGAVAD